MFLIALYIYLEQKLYPYVYYRNVCLIKKVFLFYTYFYYSHITVFIYTRIYH